MAKHRVMIVDDQLIARRMIELLFKDNDDYEIVHSLSSCIFCDAYVLNDDIDLVIMDILMIDGSNGLEAAKKIKKYDPKIKIIMMTSIPEASWIDMAKEIGVDSFLYKESMEDNLLDIVKKTMNGECIYPLEVPKIKVGPLSNASFSQREKDVLREMVTGVSNAQIAQRLNLSEGTVKFHIHNMLEKTGCKTRTELAIEARVSGIVVNLKGNN